MTGSITLLYGGLAALLTFGLGLNVSLQRLSDRAFIDAEPSKALLFRVRAHGNAAEWVPLAIVLMLVLEVSGADGQGLHGLGGTFVLGRVMHAAGLLGRLGRIRIAGTVLFYLATLLLSAWAVVRHFGG